MIHLVQYDDGRRTLVDFVFDAGRRMYDFLWSLLMVCFLVDRDGAIDIMLSLHYSFSPVTHIHQVTRS